MVRPYTASIAARGYDLACVSEAARPCVSGELANADHRLLPERLFGDPGVDALALLLTTPAVFLRALDSSLPNARDARPSVFLPV